MAGSKRRHTDTDNSDSKPTWDGHSITMRKWLNDIYLHLEETDRDFETLVRHLRPGTGAGKIKV